MTLTAALRWAFPLLALLIAIRPQTDPDLWWHIRSGQVMAETGAVLRADLFSHTLTGQLRPHHEWLSQLPLAWLYDRFGHTGNQLFVMAYVLGIVALAYGLMRGHLGVRSVVFLIGCVAASIAWLARPQLAMLLLSVVVFALVVRWRRGLFALPVLAALWVNLHGSWVMLFVLCGAAWVGEAWQLARKTGGDIAYLRRLTIWAALAVPALLLNPYGVEMLTVLSDTFTQTARPYITEWLPPSPTNPLYVPFFVLLPVVAVGLWVGRDGLRPAEVLTVVGLALWALLTGRVVPVFSLIGAVVSGSALAMWADRRGMLPLADMPTPNGTRVRVLFVAVLMLAVGVRFFSQTQPAVVQAALADLYPVEALRVLRAEGLPAPIFNEYNWGGYLILYAPEYPVFMDGRADLYDDFFDVYHDVIRVQGDWQATLDRFGVQTMLVYTGHVLDDALRVDAGWEWIYGDDVASVYRRRS